MYFLFLFLVFYKPWRGW